MSESELAELEKFSSTIYATHVSAGHYEKFVNPKEKYSVDIFLVASGKRIIETYEKPSAIFEKINFQDWGFRDSSFVESLKSLNKILDLNDDLNSTN